MNQYYSFFFFYFHWSAHCCLRVDINVILMVLYELGAVREVNQLSVRLWRRLWYSPGYRVGKVPPTWLLACLLFVICVVSFFVFQMVLQSGTKST